MFFYNKEKEKTNKRCISIFLVTFAWRNGLFDKKE